MLRLNLVLALTTLSAFLFCNPTQAETTTTTVVEKPTTTIVEKPSGTTTTTTVVKRTIVTPAPKSVSCTTVEAHWDGNVWVGPQTMCKYQNRPEGAAWVQDYWACTRFTADGNCNTWVYKPGHWVKTYP